MELKPIVKFQDLLKYELLGVRVEKEYAQKIKKLIQSKFGSFKHASKLAGLNHVTISRIERMGTRLYNWKKILNLLDINLNEIEKHIVGVSYKNIYKIKFPYSISPLLIRLAAHTIGDGGFYIHNARWVQKNVDPIIDLQKQLLGFFGSKTVSKSKVEQVSIMSFYIILACTSINIKRNEVCSENFIKACMNLPKEYKVQVLAALIEDEGSIHPKGSKMSIGMKDYKIMNSLAELMDDLGYERSTIKKIKSTGFHSDDEYIFMYTLNLRILGAHKFCNDLNEAITKYGKLAGLWKKQKKLQDLILFNDGRKAKGEKLNDGLAVKTINLMKKNNGRVTYKTLKSFLNVSHHRTGSVVRRLHNKKIIDKVRRGVYVLK